MTYSHSYLSRNPVYRTVMLLPLLLPGVLLADTSSNSVPQDSFQAIINGTPATENQQPWMAALLTNRSDPDVLNSQAHFCGGTLIASDWVLTAGHCVLGTSPSAIKVHLGASDLDGGDGQLFAVSDIVVHPRYFGTRSLTDIALLKLEAPTQLEPLPLFTDVAAQAIDDEAIVYGWGLTSLETEECEVVFADANIDPNDYYCSIHDFDSSDRGRQPELLQLSLEVIPSNDCIQAVIDNFGNLFGTTADDEAVIPEPEDFPAICAGSTEEESGACFGDSGGPLVLNQGDNLSHLGIVSFGLNTQNCGGEGSLAVFVKTGFYLDFINDVMGRDFALSFERLCPPLVTPEVDFTPLENGDSEVRIFWDAYENATNYTLRFANFPDPGGNIDSVVIDGALSQISGQLQSGLSFYITLQAHNDYCSGPSSSLVTLEVP